MKPPSADKVRCPLCGSSRVRHGFRRGTHTYVHCRNCLSYRLDPLPPRHELRQVFSAYYPQEGALSAKRTLHAKVLDELERWKPEKGRLLDVGAGYGQLVGLALARRWQAAALETVPACADHIEKQHGVKVVRAMIETARLEPSTFDAVTMIDVLDQSQDPRRNVKTAASLLSPGGILFIRVRNGSLHAPITRLIRAFHIPLPSPAWLPILHVWGLAPASLVMLCRQAGLVPLRPRNGPWAAASTYGGGWRVALLKNAVFYASEAARWASRGRFLFGPSISIIARKPVAPQSTA